MSRTCSSTRPSCNYEYHTKFIDQTPELFDFAPRRDRATKILTYIADITVNEHAEVAGRVRPMADLRLPKAPQPASEVPAKGLKQMLDSKGPEAVAKWMSKQKQLLLTDTTMRDSHQSLLATRMRSIDMINIAPNYAADMPGLFSSNAGVGRPSMWPIGFFRNAPGSACATLRRAMPNHLTQMLLRGSNGVGYTNYPDNVVQAFVAQAADTGIDLFRVFDPLNWVENMRVSMDAVLETGRIWKARSVIPATYGPGAIQV